MKAWWMEVRLLIAAHLILIFIRLVPMKHPKAYQILTAVQILGKAMQR